MKGEVKGMKKNSKLIGDEHVKSVHQALLQFLRKQPMDYYSNTVKQTVYFITNLYPNIELVASKFENGNPDQANDLTLYMNNNEKVTVNLFLIKKGGRIQPKNPGAKSFFSKYFLSGQLQEMFNQQFESKYFEYLKEL